MDRQPKADARARGLSDRARKLLVLTVVAVLAVTGAGYWVATSGLFAPRLGPGPGWGPSSYVYADGTQSMVADRPDRPSKRLSFTFAVRNSGAFDAEILAAGESLPGLRLTETRIGSLHWVPATGWTVGGRPLTSAEPHLLESGNGVEVELEYAVDDCAARPAERRPIPVRAAGVFGEQTVWITLPAAKYMPGHGWGTRADEGDPNAVADWSGHLVESACRPFQE